MLKIGEHLLRHLLIKIATDDDIKDAIKEGASTVVEKAKEGIKKVKGALKST